VIIDLGQYSIIHFSLNYHKHFCELKRDVCVLKVQFSRFFWQHDRYAAANWIELAAGIWLVFSDLSSDIFDHL